MKRTKAQERQFQRELKARILIGEIFEFKKWFGIERTLEKARAEKWLKGLQR